MSAPGELHAMTQIPPELRTERLVLRRWRPEDREPFAALNADPEGMRWYPKPLGREESDALVERIEEAIERDGFGLWAVEVSGVEPFIGYVGLAPVPFDAHFTPRHRDRLAARSPRLG
jgi:ribosomal-protein-alanine N-acetyltransferase